MFGLLDHYAEGRKAEQEFEIPSIKHPVSSSSNQITRKGSSQADFFFDCSHHDEDARREKEAIKRSIRHGAL